MNKNAMNNSDTPAVSDISKEPTMPDSNDNDATSQAATPAERDVSLRDRYAYELDTLKLVGPLLLLAASACIPLVRSCQRGEAELARREAYCAAHTQDARCVGLWSRRQASP